MWWLIQGGMDRRGFSPSERGLTVTGGSCTYYYDLLTYCSGSMPVSLTARGGDKS